VLKITDEHARRVNASAAAFASSDNAVLGWRFLLSPRESLNNCREGTLAIVALNPGGREPIPPLGDVPENAYLVAVKEAGLPPTRLRVHLESDKDTVHTVSAKLAKPMKCFYQLLATALGREGQESEIARSTLQINYCPFQSPSWKTLAFADQAKTFCKSLWDDILAEIAPSAVLVLGIAAQKEIARALYRASWTSGEVDTFKVGWGKVTCDICNWTHCAGSGGAAPAMRHLLVVRSPHWSQYPLFYRAECTDAVTKMVSSIARRLQQHSKEAAAACAAAGKRSR
jgi:hypothetical protein